MSFSCPLELSFSWLVGITTDCDAVTLMGETIDGIIEDGVGVFATVGTTVVGSLGGLTAVEGNVCLINWYKEKFSHKQQWKSIRN